LALTPNNNDYCCLHLTSIAPHFLFRCTKLMCSRKQAFSEIWIMAWILWRDTLCWSTQAGDLSNDSLIDFMSQEGLRVMVTVLVRLACWHVNPSACVSSIHGRVTQTLLRRVKPVLIHRREPLLFFCRHVRASCHSIFDVTSWQGREACGYLNLSIPGTRLSKINTLMYVCQQQYAKRSCTR